MAGGGVLKNCKISINGDNNVIEIAENVHIIDGDFCIEDSNNKIFINEKSNLCGKIHLAVTEGTEIRIGKECLFSSEIVFRTGDSHSILDMEGNRINFAKNIVVGDKVWIGHRVLVTKNVVLPKGTIVGTGAVVTRSFDEENIVIAGNPANLIKENVQGEHER